MIDFVYSLLLSLSFFAIVLRIVTEIALERRSYSFKLQSMISVYLIATMFVTLLIVFNVLSLGMSIGYGVGLSISSIIDQRYFDKKLKMKLNIRKAIQDPEEIFRQDKEKV